MLFSSETEIRSDLKVMDLLDVDDEPEQNTTPNLTIIIGTSVAGSSFIVIAAVFLKKRKGKETSEDLK